MLPYLSELVLAVDDEVEYAPDGCVCDQRLLVEVDDPVGVGQHVDVLLQAVLKGAGLEQRAVLRAVTRRNHHLNREDGSWFQGRRS